MLTYHDIRTGNLQAIREFLQSHDVNSQLEHGTPLTVASFEGRVNVVKFLLDAGADPNYPANYGSTPLMAAANDGRTRVIEILLDAGADPNLADPNGQTALHHLVFCPRITAPDIARLLISRGADALKKNNKGETAYRVALEKRMKEGYASIVTQELVYALAHRSDE